MNEKIIESFDVPGGVRLVAEPFSEPNKNADCEVVSEIKFQAGKRSIRIQIADLKWMRISDVAILITVLRTMVEESQKHTSIPKKRPATKAKKRPATKAKKRPATKAKKRPAVTTKPKRTSATHKKKRVKKR